MDAEWDEKKRLSNIEKHGIDFFDAVKIFDGTVLVREERRRDYGEERFSAVGDVDGRILYVVYTPRGGKLRIITARRAGRDEREGYYKSIA
jgi:uncharacterized DUF497 family protein